MQNNDEDFIFGISLENTPGGLGKDSKPAVSGGPSCSGNASEIRLSSSPPESVVSDTERAQPLYVRHAKHARLAAYANYAMWARSAIRTQFLLKETKSALPLGLPSGMENPEYSQDVEYAQCADNAEFANQAIFADSAMYAQDLISTPELSHLSLITIVRTQSMQRRARSEGHMGSSSQTTLSINPERRIEGFDVGKSSEPPGGQEKQGRSR